MERYYKSSWRKIVEDLNSDEQKGLSEYERLIRREYISDNEIKYESNFIKIIKSSISVWECISLIFIICILLYSKYYILLYIALAFNSINIIYKLYVAFLSNEKFQELDKLNSVKTIIISDGDELEIDAEELVIGDIVVLRKGDIVGGDLRLIKSEKLKVKDINVTGQNILKEKETTSMSTQPISLGQISNMVFRGSEIVDGYGVGVVIKCGNETQIGKLLNYKEKIHQNKNNIIKNVDSRLIKSNIILIITAILLYVIFPSNGDVKKSILVNSIFSTSTILIAAIYFIYGKWIYKDLIKEEIYLNNISAIGDSKDIKVIFLDKVGSITKEEYKVVKIFSEGKYFNKEQIKAKDINIKRMLDILYINSSSFEDTGVEVDAIEKCYLKCNESIAYPEKTVKLYNNFRFRVERDYNNPVYTTVTKGKKGFRVNVRGQLDEVLIRCSHILINGVEKPLTDSEIDKIRVAESIFSREGLNIEAVSYKSLSYEPNDGANIQSNLVFVGIIAMENILIEGIEATIKESLENEILPIIFCEDNRVVAESFGRKIGVISSIDEVITGEQLQFKNDKDFYKLVSKGVIFAKVSPQQRMRIIDAFYRDGFNVASEGSKLIQLSSFVKSKVSIAKGKASELLRSITDVHSNINGIRTILILKQKDIELNKSIDEANYIYLKFISAQILVSFLYYQIEKQLLFMPISIVVLNAIILIPIILCALETNIEKISNYKKKSILAIFYTGIAGIGVISFKESTEVMMLILLVSNMFVYLIVNLKYNIKNIITVCIGTLISVLALSFTYYITKAAFYKIEIIILITLITIYSLVIIILKKWQK